MLAVCQPLPVAFRGHRTAAASPAGVSFQITVPKLSSSQISWGSAKGPDMVSGGKIREGVPRSDSMVKGPRSPQDVHHHKRK